MCYDEIMKEGIKKVVNSTLFNMNDSPNKYQAIGCAFDTPPLMTAIDRLGHTIHRHSAIVGSNGTTKKGAQAYSQLSGSGYNNASINEHYD